jgi:serine O-acetyltransferase
MIETLQQTCLSRDHHKLATIWNSLSEDILRYLNKSPENQASGDNLKTRTGALLTPQLLCLVLYRISHYVYVKGWKRCAILLARMNYLTHKVSIAPQCCIGPGCFLPHPAGVTFFGTAGRGLTLYALAICCPVNTVAEEAVEMGPCLGDYVVIGGHAVVLGPVRIGHHTTVAFGVRLDRDAGDNVIAISGVMRTRNFHSPFDQVRTQ